MFADCVPGVADFLAFEGVFKALNNRLVAVAVVDDRVTFAAVYERLNEIYAFSGDGDDGVDVRGLGELDGVCSLEFVTGE